MAKRKSAALEQPELARDQCPNCGGPLKFPENWKEGLCSTCGIFVEVLSSTPDKGPLKERELPDVKSRRESAKFYLASEDLLEEQEEGEAPAESGQAEPTPLTPPSEQALTEPEAAPEPQGPVAAALDLPPAEKPAGEGETGQEETPAPRRSPAEVSPLPSPPPTEPQEPTLPTPPPEPQAPEPEERDQEEPEVSEEAPVPAEAEAVVEPQPEVAEELEVAYPPRVEPEAVVEAAAPAYAASYRESPRTAAKSVAPVARAQTTTRPGMAQARLRDRVLLYVGSVTVAFGGSGLMLGSILHDWFRVPLFGQAYSTFGPLNMSALLFGAVFLLSGLAAIGVSLRGGVVNVRRAARA